MVVTIIGWYGTETMGDIAIFDGILSVLNELDATKVYLGCLFPFYSERTLYDNKTVFGKTAPNIEIELFDSKDEDNIKTIIDKTDMLLFGGGPLMDISELYLMERYFKYAKKKSVKSYVMGCGIGPLFKEQFIKTVGSIFSCANKVSLRDHLSLKEAQKLFDNSIASKCSCLGDPAVISIEEYKKSNSFDIANENNEKVIAFNLRDYPRTIYKNDSVLTDNDYVSFINELSKHFDKVLLVPMLSFSAGHDDRYYLAKLKMDIESSNVEVLHHPFSLYELYDLYTKSYGCIGMRHHSVVMQTILNGNNIVIDYTEPEVGKTQGFIKEVDHVGFYQTRTISLQQDIKPDLKEYIDTLEKNERFNYVETNIKKEYIKWLKD